MTQTQWPYVPIIADVAAQVAVAPDLRTLSNDIFPSVARRLGAATATLALLEDDRLRPIGVVGRGGSPWAAVRLSEPAPMAAAARLGAPVVVPDARTARDEFPALAAAGSSSVCALPLTVGDRVVGAVELGWDHPRELDPVDVQALTTLATLMAAACDGAPMPPSPRRPLNRLAPFAGVEAVGPARSRVATGEVRRAR